MALNKNTNLMYSDGGANTPNVGGIAAGAVIGATGTVKGSGKTGDGTKASTGTFDPQPIDAGFDIGAYYAQLAAEAQAKADAAYQRNMERISSAYGSAADSLSGNYNSTVSRLNAARDKSMGDVRGDAEKSLQEAYINNMLTRKNLNQRLSAMGYNGGATETTMAGLENQYGNSRTGINETLNKNLSDLNMTYGDNLAAALQSYNSAKANLDLQRMQLEMQAENARQNAEASSMSAYMNIDSGYLNALQAALKNQAAYQYDPTQATNQFVAGNAQQAASASEGANYSKYLAQAQLQASQGASTSTIRNNLFNAVQSGEIGIDTLYNILSQLRAS